MVPLWRQKQPPRPAPSIVPIMPPVWATDTFGLSRGSLRGPVCRLRWSNFKTTRSTIHPIGLLPRGQMWLWPIWAPEFCPFSGAVLRSNFGISGWVVLIFFGAILVLQTIQQVSKVVPKCHTPLEDPAPAKCGCGLHERHKLEN